MAHQQTSSWSGQRRGFPKRTARAILRRDKVCQLGYAGCEETPTEADHIVGHADAQAAGWDPRDIDDATNGQAVCTPCHRRKTLQEQARGRARAAARKPRSRPASKHPGLIE